MDISYNSLELNRMQSVIINGLSQTEWEITKNGQPFIKATSYENQEKILFYGAAGAFTDRETGILKIEINRLKLTTEKNITFLI